MACRRDGRTPPGSLGAPNGPTPPRWRGLHGETRSTDQAGDPTKRHIGDGPPDEPGPRFRDGGPPRSTAGCRPGDRHTPWGCGPILLIPRFRVARTTLESRRSTRRRARLRSSLRTRGHRTSTVRPELHLSAQRKRPDRRCRSSGQPRGEPRSVRRSRSTVIVGVPTTSSARHRLNPDVDPSQRLMLVGGFRARFADAVVTSPRHSDAPVFSVARSQTNQLYQQFDAISLHIDLRSLSPSRLRPAPLRSVTPSATRKQPRAY